MIVRVSCPHCDCIFGNAVHLVKEYGCDEVVCKQCGKRYSFEWETEIKVSKKVGKVER